MVTHDWDDARGTPMMKRKPRSGVFNATSNHWALKSPVKWRVVVESYHNQTWLPRSVNNHVFFVRKSSKSVVIIVNGICSIDNLLM